MSLALAACQSFSQVLYRAPISYLYSPSVSKYLQSNQAHAQQPRLITLSINAMELIINAPDAWSMQRNYGQNASELMANAQEPWPMQELIINATEFIINAPDTRSAREHSKD